jgi:hypothetical protein
VFADLHRVRRQRNVPRGVAPLIPLMLALDGLGELLGYASGPGASLAKLSALEFHREWYLVPADVAALPL